MFPEHCYVYYSSPTFQHFSNKHLEFNSSSICITSMRQSRSLWDLLIFFWSLWWKLRALFLEFFVFYFVRQVWKQVADSNTEWLLNMYTAFIYVGSEWQCSLRVETMAFSLYPWQLAQGRAHRWHVRGAQCMFILCIYSHVHIPWRQGSQIHMLMVTGYWPGVITREWWEPIRELMPYERSSPSHHMGILSVVRLLHLSEDAVTSNLYVNCPDFKTVCQMKQIFWVNLAHGQPNYDPQH